MSHVVMIVRGMSRTSRESKLDAIRIELIHYRFHEDVTVSVSAAEGLTCAARKSDLLSVASFAPSGTLPTSWSRHKTAKFLREKFADKCASGQVVVNVSHISLYCRR